MTSPYNPEFQFTDWPDGPLNANLPPAPLSPNAVVNQVEAEFQSIATAIAQLSTRLDALAQPRPRSVLIAPTPAFVAVDGHDPWIYDFGIAKKKPGSAKAVGFMPLHLPDGAKITSFRAKGTKAAGNLRLELQRGLMQPHDAQVVVSIWPMPPTGAFDVSTPISGAQPIDNNLYRYWIAAKILDSPTAGVVEIHGFQVTYVVQ